MSHGAVIGLNSLADVIHALHADGSAQRSKAQRSSSQAVVGLRSFAHVQKSLQADESKFKDKYDLDSSVKVAPSAVKDTQELDIDHVRQEAERVYQAQVDGCLYRSRLSQAIAEVSSSLGITPPQHLIKVLEVPLEDAKDSEISLEAFLQFADGALRRSARRSMHASNLVTARRASRANVSVFNDSFELLKPLGEGSFGRVLLCRDRRSGVEQVVKIIDKGDKTASDIQSINFEIEVLKNLDHPNIVRLHEALEDNTVFQLVFEVCAGGELVEEVGKFTDVGSQEMIASIVKQILLAVAYCHGKNVLHNDLKLDNVLLAQPFVQGTIPHVLVADFGLAEVFRVLKELPDPEKEEVAVAGTPLYMAPERWYGIAVPGSDIWSVGVMAFALLTGNFPWAEPQNTETQQKVPSWSRIKDSQARRLVKMMLRWDVTCRPPAQECLNHVWLGGSGISDDLQPPVDENESEKLEVSKEALHVFCKRSEIERIAAQMCVWNLPHSSLAEVTRKFEEMDVNHDSQLTFNELQTGLLGLLGPDWMSLPQGKMLCEALDMFQALDTDLSGSITWSEFAAGVVRLSDETLEKTLWQCFQAFDVDQSHYLERQELEGMLQLLHFGSVGDDIDQKIAQEIVSIGKSVDDMWTEMDQDCDGKIDFVEFKGYLQRQLSAKQSTTDI
eukprot:gnl/MRDRNA2_/MRDRNA2_80577_c0_seq1.p1 gnl/MRDRNA2_/MRDRNA2_80577_c0~~gnl/MRDRNA2_/MRDRNA2_80577_c0_seq1.p1  ORF type:complete len:671 (+),score=119.66 gnl/MRDRNA2_/MRDRNA2_80577_c0_seq1:86-2098(+)